LETRKGKRCSRETAKPKSNKWESRTRETRKNDPLGVFEAQGFQGPIKKINLVANRNNLNSLTPPLSLSLSLSQSLYIYKKKLLLAVSLSLQKVQKRMSLSWSLSLDGIEVSNSSLPMEGYHGGH
jgi:hypothetical protein